MYLNLIDISKANSSVFTKIYVKRLINDIDRHAVIRVA